MRLPRLLPRLLDDQRGQASLMIGMMVMTFILFFAFVVNTGMLVNAKINLQNAADLAAYSGAATQARQLTQISYLNYEMRRQYKKFLFRYYIVGNMAQQGFPRAPGSTNKHFWSPNGVSDYQVPAVCLIFDSAAGSNDNYCQIDKLPAINIPPSNPLDAINETLRQQLQAIESIRQSNCGAIGTANLTILSLWLFNTDPDFSRLPSALAATSDPNIPKILTTSQAVARGLGLVPREVILRQRIATLAGYVNEAAQKGVTRQNIQMLQGNQDPAAYERTIQAFLSAYYTLGEHTFDPSGIAMDELLPGSTDQANLLQLTDIKQDFDTYAVRYVQAGGLELAAGAAVDCQPRLEPIPVRNVPLGVAKDPATLTYYAIRLSATAKVMFSPFGDMQLKAYAAARPFGSRIGPMAEVASTQFAYDLMPSNPQFFISPVPDERTGHIPNLPILAGETSASIGKDWDTDAVLGEMYAQIFGGSPGNSAALQASDFTQGERAAMAPNPSEGNLYNVINDQGNDPFVRNFDLMHQSSFWAPVVTPDKVSNLQNVLTSALQTIFQTAAIGGNPGQQTTSTLFNSIMQDVISYAGTLESGQGEEIVPGVREGLNIAHISDPFTGANGQPLAMPGLMMTDPKQFKTSFVSALDSNIQQQGRVGYSVKFVSFDSLQNPLSSNGQTVPTNTKTFADDQAILDIKGIKH